MKLYEPILRAGGLLLLFCLFISGVARPAEGTDEQIVFLTLRFDTTSVYLVNSRTVSGHLKTNRGPSSGEIHYELLGDSGLLLQGAIANPLVRRFEYEDPDNTGKLITKIVNLSEATISLRVPYNSNIKQLIFYRTEPSSSGNSKIARSAWGVVDLTSVHRGEK